MISERPAINRERVNDSGSPSLGFCVPGVSLKLSSLL